MRLFPGYKLYPVVQVDGKKAIDTEYGMFEVSEYESHCHECKQSMAYQVEVEDEPQMACIKGNFYVPYFYYLHADCPHGVHGGFARPIWPLKKKRIQRTLEDFL